MNNEPVAWNEEEIKKACRHVGLTEHMILKIKAYLPVHTHPAKTTLSRMEVYELAIDSGFMLSTQYGQSENKLMPVSDGDTLVKLARAILRKAQEK